MSRDTRCVRRRSVLKAAGTAAVAGLAATGTAAAGHFMIGQPVVVTREWQSYAEACPRDVSSYVFQAGEDGIVLNTCTPDSEHYDEWVLVDTNNPLNRKRGWLPHAVLREP